jgi:hypothetical protein
MFTTQMFWPDMVNSEIAGTPSAILADISVTPKNLTAGQLDMQAWAVDHLFQADDGGDRYGLSDCLNIAATIHDQIGFPQKDQANSAAGVTNINRLKIRVENQYWRVHSASTLACIILHTWQVF